MKRPELSLYAISFSTLVNSIQKILDSDILILDRELKNWESKDENYKNRLAWAIERHDFIQELICRCQLIELTAVMAAFEEAKAEAVRRGTPKNFKFTLEFNNYNPPILYIH